MTPWSELPGAAVQITMVTSRGGTSASGDDIKQTPWVMNKDGAIYYFSAVDGQNSTYGQYGQWVQIPTIFPAQYVTDGFVLTAGGVFFSEDNIEGIWPIFIGLPQDEHGNIVKLKQIAAGGSISAAVAYGPPDDRIEWDTAYPWWGSGFTGTPLWGLDYAGNIWLVVEETVVPVQ